MVINGNLVKTIVTKFYFKNDNLCYEICLKHKDGAIIPYAVYTEYTEYKKEFNLLLIAKELNKEIEVADDADFEQARA